MPQDSPCQISRFWVYPIVPFPRNGQNMPLLWPKQGPHMVLQIVFFENHNQYAQGGLHGRSNWFFLTHIQCAQGSSMPNYTILGVSHSPLFIEMAKIWPFYGQSMVLKISSSWIIINVPREAPCKISQFRVYPIVPFSQKGPKYGPFMAKTWSPNGPSN